MSHYDTFRGQLAIKYPSYGHALWEPSPSELYGPVEVGDVGFIREGRFYRLFNALLSADHPSHMSGVPEHHEPLIPKLSDHVIRSTLSPGHYCSAGIDMMALEPDVRALGWVINCSNFLTTDMFLAQTTVRRPCFRARTNEEARYYPFQYQLSVRTPLRKKPLASGW